MNISKAPTYDVIVIGAGHNGLVTAAYLAKSGRRVLVVEKRRAVGGAASSEEIFTGPWAGFRADTGAVDAGLFLPHIADDLKLERFGLQWLHSPALVFAPQPDGRALTIWRDVHKTAAGLAHFSPADAQKYPDFARLVGRLADVLASMMALTPPALPSVHMGDLLPWLRPALQVKRLGDHDLIEFLRLLPMPVSDFLDEWFETPGLKAALGASGVSGGLLGPMGSGSAFMFLYQAVNAGAGAVRASAFVRGGAGALSQALAKAAQEAGVELRLDCGVKRILLQDGKALGVETEDGESITGRAVASSADPRTTLFGLVGAPHLPLRVVREVKNIRLRASTARLNLALSGAPRFTALDGGKAGEHLSGHILIAPSLEYIERAYDDAKYGRFSRQPLLDIVIPSLTDASLAPPSMQLMTINVQYAPYALQGDGGPGQDWAGQGERLVEIVLDTLEAYAPGLRSLVTQRHLLAPPDLERQYGLAGGDIYHGQMGLDQLLFMRPIPGFGQYAMPVENLYLCGAGAHPGGGLTGAPGYNAARHIHKQLGSA